MRANRRAIISNRKNIHEALPTDSTEEETPICNGNSRDQRKYTMLIGEADRNYLLPGNFESQVLTRATWNYGRV